MLPEVIVQLPCLPHVATFLNAKYPNGIPMNLKDRYGKVLFNLATSPVKNKSYHLRPEYSASVKVVCSRNLIWRYGQRSFHPQNVVRFNDLVDDDMLNDLYTRISIYSTYEVIQEKNIIMLFMDDNNISEFSTFDKWRRAVTRKKESLKSLSQSVLSIPNLSSNQI
jgi:hypothetical protein